MGAVHIIMSGLPLNYALLYDLQKSNNIGCSIDCGPSFVSLYAIAQCACTLPKDDEGIHMIVVPLAGMQHVLVHPEGNFPLFHLKCLCCIGRVHGCCKGRQGKLHHANSKLTSILIAATFRLRCHTPHPLVHRIDLGKLLRGRMARASHGHAVVTVQRSGCCCYHRQQSSRHSSLGWWLTSWLFFLIWW